MTPTTMALINVPAKANVKMMPKLRKKFSCRGHVRRAGVARTARRKANDPPGEDRSR